MLRTYAFVLAVADLDRSAAYYRDVLGFCLFWEDGTDWRLAQRDGVRLMLGHCPNEKPATEIFPHDWFGYLETEDVDALRAEFVGRGAQCSEPKDQPYGMREIIVTTIDGHRIVFGQENPRWSDSMFLNLSHIGQIAQPVSDVDRAEDFYENVIGLRKLYRFGDLTFFDCAGVRLLLEKTHDGSPPRQGGVIYFRCADIALTVSELERRGVVFTQRPHFIAKMDDHDLWMAFFDDPDGHTLAVMHEAHKGYALPTS